MLLRTDVPSRCLVLLRCIALQELMKRLQRAEYTLPDTASKELADFLALMIQPDPTKRLGAEEALKHPWVLADDQTEEQVDVSAKQASSCKRYPPCRLAHQLPACQLTFLVRSPPVSLVSYRIVSYRIVSYRIVSYRNRIESYAGIAAPDVKWSDRHHLRWRITRAMDGKARGLSTSSGCSERCHPDRGGFGGAIGRGGCPGRGGRECARAERGDVRRQRQRLALDRVDSKVVAILVPAAWC
jgi:serine/threonine protein kinase